ncbi:hypothetical protein AVEN_14004-1 [Araneus ventricosus]|uniref:Uncharacterized protein n=1 Tax=Araneus ventricosus TaxID=182803 RepID=A0A4Y2WRH0_ARAVE|nr:hypothetical protein AVEN_14004-1 [Araneus ventricosus]
MLVQSFRSNKHSLFSLPHTGDPPGEMSPHRFKIHVCEGTQMDRKAQLDFLAQNPRRRVTEPRLGLPVCEFPLGGITSTWMKSRRISKRRGLASLVGIVMVVWLCWPYPDDET